MNSTPALSNSTTAALSVLSWTNPGEIDPLAFTTLGVNAKPEAGAIGFFGTGLKYAIAGALRLGGQVTIFSGLTCYEFKLVHQDFRGKPVGVIACERDGVFWQNLGYTTELGKTWTPWMLYRELWSNCKDEGGTPSARLGKPPGANEGFTSIIVANCPALVVAHQTQHEWQAPRSAPAWSNGDLDIWAEPSKCGFYRGLKVLDFAQPADLTFNVKSHLPLTEDRTVAEWWFKSAVATAVAKCVDHKGLLNSLLVPKKDSFESKLEYNYLYLTPSSDFVEMVEECREFHSASMNRTALEYAKRHTPIEPPREITLAPDDHDMLIDAQAALARQGIQVKRPIKVVEQLAPGAIGLWDGSVIWLSLDTISKGLRCVTSTLLEEHLHAELGLKDESRELQNWLLDRLIAAWDAAP